MQQGNSSSSQNIQSKAADTTAPHTSARSALGMLDGSVKPKTTRQSPEAMLTMEMSRLNISSRSQTPVSSEDVIDGMVARANPAASIPIAPSVAVSLQAPIASIPNLTFSQPASMQNTAGASAPPAAPGEFDPFGTNRPQVKDDRFDQLSISSLGFTRNLPKSPSLESKEQHFHRSRRNSNADSIASCKKRRDYRGSGRDLRSEGYPSSEDEKARLYDSEKKELPPGACSADYYDNQDEYSESEYYEYDAEVATNVSSSLSTIYQIATDEEIFGEKQDSDEMYGEEQDSESFYAESGSDDIYGQNDNSDTSLLPHSRKTGKDKKPLKHSQKSARQSNKRGKKQALSSESDSDSGTKSNRHSYRSHNQHYRGHRHRSRSSSGAQRVYLELKQESPCDSDDYSSRSTKIKKKSKPRSRLGGYTELDQESSSIEEMEDVDVEKGDKKKKKKKKKKKEKEEKKERKKKLSRERKILSLCFFGSYVLGLGAFVAFTRSGGSGAAAVGGMFGLSLSASSKNEIEGDDNTVINSGSHSFFSWNDVYRPPNPQLMQSLMEQNKVECLKAGMIVQDPAERSWWGWNFQSNSPTCLMHLPVQMIKGYCRYLLPAYEKSIQEAAKKGADEIQKKADDLTKPQPQKQPRPQDEQDGMEEYFDQEYGGGDDYSYEAYPDEANDIGQESTAQTTPTSTRSESQEIRSTGVSATESTTNITNATASTSRINTSTQGQTSPAITTNNPARRPRTDTTRLVFTQRGTQNFLDSIRGATTNAADAKTGLSWTKKGNKRR